MTDTETQGLIDKPRAPYEAASADSNTPGAPVAAAPMAGDSAPVNAQKLTKRHYILLTEMLFLSLSTMYVEMCMVPALPTISASWPEQKHFVPWVISAYNIAGAVWTPIAGSLADIYGPKWIAIFSLAVYMCGQIGCALSPNLWVLIAFRACQGFGMAIFVLCFAIIKLTFPVKTVPVAIGTISAMFSIGMCIGLVGGAFAMENMSNWQNVFWTTFPVILIIAIAFTVTMPSFRGVNSKRRPDFIGAALITAGVVLFLLGLTLSSEWGWTDWKTLLLVIGGLAVLGVFVKVELMVRDPLVSIRLLIKRNLALAAATAFTVGLSLFSLFQVSPYLMRDPYNDILPMEKKTMSWMGLCMLPFGLTQFITAPAAGILGRKLGFALLSSIAMFGISLTLFIGAPCHDTLTAVELLTTLMGASFGVIMVAIMNIVSEATTKEQFGSASGTNTLFRIFGGAVGPVCVNLVLFNGAIPSPDTCVVDSSSGSGSSSLICTPGDLIPSKDGYTNSYLVMGGFAAVGLVCALFTSGLFKSCQKVTPEEERKALLRSKNSSASGFH